MTGNADTKNSCTVASVFISFSLLIRILWMIFKYDSLEVVFWRCSAFTKLLLNFLKKFNSERLVLSQLPCKPSELPAKKLYDLKKQNLRTEINNTIISSARSIVSSIRNQLNLSSIFPIWSANKIIPAYLEFKIAENIEDSVYLAYHLKFRQINENRNRNRIRQSILYVPTNWWGKKLVHTINMPFKVIIGGRVPGIVLKTYNFIMRRYDKTLKKLFARKNSQQSIHSTTYLYHLISHLEENNFNHKNFMPIEPFNGRIAVIISDGISPDRRNNLNWMWGSNIIPGEIVALWDNTYRLPTNLEYKLVEKLGLKIFKRKTHYNNSDKCLFPVWKPTFKYYIFLFFMMAKFIKLIMKTVGRLNKKTLWAYIQTVILLKNIAWWYDFFKFNDIKVYMEDNYGDEIYQQSVAIDMAGGVNVLIERSMVYGNHSYFDDRPANISFLSGSYMINQMVDPDKIMHKFIVGYYYDQMDKGVIEKQKEILKYELQQAGALNNGPLILICDEPGVIYGKDVIHYFYRALLNDLHEKKGYTLLIKPKKKLILLGLPRDVNKCLTSLIEKKRCFVLDPSTSISLAVNISELVISVPSTAMFTSIAHGKRTAVFNPYRTVKDIFYEQGLENKSIFEDLNCLLNSLHEYLEGRFSEFGDCSAVHKIIDPFRDGKAGERMSLFIKKFLEHLQLYGDREIAIGKAKEEFLKFHSAAELHPINPPRFPFLARMG